MENGVDEIGARRFARDLALVTQAALLAQTAPASVFAAFCESRLDGAPDAFGQLGAGDRLGFDPGARGAALRGGPQRQPTIRQDDSHDMTTSSWQGRTAVITGAASGFGLETSRLARARA